MGTGEGSGNAPEPNGSSIDETGTNNTERATEHSGTQPDIVEKSRSPKGSDNTSASVDIIETEAKDVDGTHAVAPPEGASSERPPAALEAVWKDLKKKGSTSKRFNKVECPQGALTLGCSIEETRDSCIVTFTP